MIQQVGSEIIETIFCPKAVAKQLAVLICLEAGVVTVDQLSYVAYRILSHFSSRKRLIHQLQGEQQCAITQDEWMDLAERIDNIQGNDVWRSDPNCPLYERDRISARIDEFVHLMRRQDIFELMFVLRGSIGRNKFGLLHEGLFTKALAGSKVLVETYHNVVCAALDFCCDAPVLPGEDPIPTDARLAFFNETRHAYGRTALLLSGGAALGFYHVGVVKTLMENRLMPRVIGGSSAGSILCAMIGTRTDDECTNDLFDAKGTDAPGHSGGSLALNFFRPLQSAVEEKKKIPLPTVGGFQEVVRNTAGAFTDVRRTVQGFVPIPLRHLSSFFYDIVSGHKKATDAFKNDTEHFRNCVRKNVGNFTFQEAFDRTGRILNIVVTPNNSTDPPRLLNYLTAPHVLVWSAAVASSSLPGVFEANRLVVKEADGWERYGTFLLVEYDSDLLAIIQCVSVSDYFLVCCRVWRRTSLL
jgi:TAG lipase/steryl ester hydrolase/phospholipase A2/LPA acyltransferase